MTCYFKNKLKYLICFIIFIIPLAWSTQVNANYYTIKTFLLYVLGCCCFLYIGFFSPLLLIPNQLKNKHKIFYSFITAILVLHVTLLVQGSIYDNLFYLAKFISMAGLFLYLLFIDFDLIVFLEKYKNYFLVFLLILTGLTSFNLISILSGPEKFWPSSLYVPFGNVNMLAEFYLFLMPFCFYFVRNCFKKNQYLLCLCFVILSTGILFFVLLSRSRSAYIGLLFLIILYVYNQYFKKMNKRLIMALIILTGAFTYQVIGQAMFSNKASSTHERLNFYKSALDLIKDNPLGVGYSYVNSIVPYRLNYPSGPNETDYPDQPHSDILKWGVQFGLPGLVLGLVGLIFLLKIVFLRPDQFLLKSLMLVILPQIFFQFPFENPASILILIIVIYQVIKIEFYQEPIFFYEEKNFLYKNTFQRLTHFSFSIIFAGCLFFVAHHFLKSVYLESNYPDDLTETTIACELNPTSLKSCVRKNYNLLSKADYKVFKQSLIKDTEKNYFSSDYLKLLGSFYQSQDSTFDLKSRAFEKNCQIIKVYAFIYKTQIHFSEQDVKLCDAVPVPIKFRTAQQFDRDFKIWFFETLNSIKL